ncbi:FCD domain-containing protein [Raineyella antarctica]|nr:FCD domain-containing protein [Raineyella antarctica]
MTQESGGLGRGDAQLRAEHHGIYDAITSGDAQAAARLIEGHTRNSHARL